MHPCTSFLLAAVTTLMITACDKAPAPAGTSSDSARASTNSGPLLTMNIDGTPAVLGEVFGAYNPKGYPEGTIILSGTIGKGRDQSGFNVWLAGVNAPGELVITNKSDKANKVQFVPATATNPFEARHLAANNKDGQSFTLRFTKLAADDLEGSFEGTLTSDNGEKVLKITEGRFDTQ